MGVQNYRVVTDIKATFIIGVVIASSVYAQKPGWPLGPQNSVHPIGNNWGEYQAYGPYYYLHPGIDVMGGPVPVYSVSHGWVKAWLTISAEYHWRVVVGDSAGADSCDGWLYAHIDPDRYHVNEGDEVSPGDLIGYLIDWPITGFTHCHFARIRNAGSTWQANWLFVENPLNLLSPNFDPDPPVSENAVGGQKFAFCKDNTSIYLNPDSLYGNVDIIARIYDKFGPPLSNPIWERLIPYAVEYSIIGEQRSVSPTIQCAFTHQLDWNNTAKVRTCYKDDNICDTQGDYNERIYYFIVTNTDGDSVLEVSDTAGCWCTTDFPDGDYWVKVTAYDQYGNTTSDSMKVTVDNYEFYKNVGVLSIVSPPDTVIYDSTYPLIAVIKNFGELTHTFDINCQLRPSKRLIDTTITISNLMPDSVFQVSFGEWVVDSAPATYEMKVMTLLASDMWTSNDTLIRTIICQEIGVEEGTFNVSFLVQNQPNPFSQKTVIRIYGLVNRESQFSKTSSSINLCAAQISIYDLGGRIICTLPIPEPTSPVTEIVWDGKNASGNPVGNGIYFYKVEAQPFTSIQKLILVR